LKVSANVKIAMQGFENFRGGHLPPSGCAPDGNRSLLQNCPWRYFHLCRITAVETVD